MRRLPPLGAIEAFVQVARLGSIKAAAEDLALSAPALSRRVQSLERFIAKPLFARRHQAMVLNADGERLLAQIAPVLDSLSDAVESLTSTTEVLRLRLGILPLYASQKLFPRLGELRKAHPELHLDIDTAAHLVSRLGDGLDAVIALSRDRSVAVRAAARSQFGLCDRRAQPARAGGPDHAARTIVDPDRAGAPRHDGYVLGVADGGGAR